MLSDLSLAEMSEYVKGLSFPTFRGKQLFDAIYNNKALEETNLPKEMKLKLEEDYPQYKILQVLTGKDGTQKFLFQFADDNVVEGVLMKYNYGNTICISTQIGCAMGCKFCASSLNGLIRNLSAGEILGQVLMINSFLGGTYKDRKITNIVLMGSGEPLDNYNNVTKFIDLVTSPDGINISMRNISLSTCGIVPKIYQLADDGYTLNLTISLHAPNDEIRKHTMPIANLYSIQQILDACKYYFDKTGRRIIFEYTLIDKINNLKLHALELEKLLKNLNCHVNLIPLNEVKERSLSSVTRKSAYQFASMLEEQGISATVRRTMGEDIGGACGQLRAKFVGNSSATGSDKKDN